MMRRPLLAFPLLLVLAFTAAPGARHAFHRAPDQGPGPGSGPTVDPARLRQRIEGLSVFGRPPGGTFADGVSRVAYSDADVAGRQYVVQLMRGAGLDPRVDPAGNIFASRSGSDGALKPILFGSHI